MTNKDGISVDEVRALLEGPVCKLVSHSDLIAHAYLALSERVGELQAAGEALWNELEWVNEGLDLMPDDYADALTRFGAALSHKGMDQ